MNNPATGDRFATYGATYAESEELPLRKHLEAPSFLSALGDLAGLAVLDAGCGSGFYARSFARSGAARVTGLDMSEGMLAVAEERERTEAYGITYVLGDLSDAGRLGPVDVVTAVYVLPYATSLAHLAAMCRGAADALRPGGRFVTFAVNPDFATDPAWYAPYGFALRCAHTGQEGEPVTLVSSMFDPPLEVALRRWSHQAHDTALRAAGFADIKWSSPQPSAAGVAEFGAEFWASYTRIPHALIVTARRH
ncbi:class I SAM-dependent methyltransferase [Nocardia brasiliensis]|uniref:class I SAM-dependent methyltransferase n=1 Tax=Nocardia brasiliensis TaxID=37326 RepID=UPI0024554560|nr:class I SAM-dependent methyltransferase [Nocardia brasiliensis]